MNYKSLHDYIRDTATGLGFDVDWFHGRIANISQLPITKSVCIFLLPMSSNGSFYANGNGVNESYAVSILVYMQDRADTGLNKNKIKNSDYQKEMDILGQTSTIANQLIRKLSDNDISTLLQNASDLLTIDSFNKGVAIKEGANNLTGTTLDFNITVPDNFDYCC